MIKRACAVAACAQVNPPTNKVWGAKDAKGQVMGWIDAPAAAHQSPGSSGPSMDPESGRRGQTPAIGPLLSEEEEEAEGE